ncbi:uridine diphosphate-N-acetylglucosamine-binding protein YvcK [Nocardia sp. NPDC024068]|uniref:gluconeogenesis factor YvcK family protein n=1 Tax=Nocardia sp. NPDC024068 TaxID=3157197 RepID=UPI0034045408
MNNPDSDPLQAADPAIVALGGGHGLYATLTAVRALTRRISAIVTVADDGGSSGRLRRELGVPPPGDLRMALAALSADADSVLTRTVQHRFGGTGALAGHSVGNLLLAGLTEVLGDPVAALDQVGALLKTTGRVLPMSTIPLDIEADVSGLETDPRVSRCIRGQVAVATTPGKVRRVRLLPADPPACVDATDAIERADTVILGPGSWFTSVIPHLLVPGLHEALVRTRARKVLILNLAAQPGETAGFSAERHLHVLSQHAPDFAVDEVLVDAGCVPEGREREHVARAAGQLRARVIFSDVADAGTARHDPGKLAAALDQLIREPRPQAPEVRVEGQHMGQDVRSGLGGKEHVSWR